MFPSLPAEVLRRFRPPGRGESLRELQRKKCQDDAEHQHPTGLPKWVQPDQQSCAKKLSRQKDNTSPNQRGGTRDEEKTIKAEAAESLPPNRSANALPAVSG